jgi:hypothetical protein
MENLCQYFSIFDAIFSYLLRKNLATNNSIFNVEIISPSGSIVLVCQNQTSGSGISLKTNSNLRTETSRSEIFVIVNLNFKVNRVSAIILQDIDNSNCQTCTISWKLKFTTNYSQSQCIPIENFIRKDNNLLKSKTIVNSFVRSRVIPEIIATQPGKSGQLFPRSLISINIFWKAFDNANYLLNWAWIMGVVLGNIIAVKLAETLHLVRECIVTANQNFHDIFNKEGQLLLGEQHNTANKATGDLIIGHSQCLEKERGDLSCRVTETPWKMHKIDSPLDARPWRVTVDSIGILGCDFAEATSANLTADYRESTYDRRNCRCRDNYRCGDGGVLGYRSCGTRATSPGEGCKGSHGASSTSGDTSSESPATLVTSNLPSATTPNAGASTAAHLMDLWHEQYLLDENFTAPGAGQLGASKSTRRADSPLGAGAETVKTYWERRALWVPCWDRVSVIWVVGRTIFLYSISTLHLLERTGEGDD